MPFAGDPDLHGAEADGVVGADHEHAFHVALADFLRRLATDGDGRVPVGQILVFTNRQGDDRDAQHFGPRRRDDLSGGREVGAGIERRVHELNAHFVIDGLIARVRRGRLRHRTVRDFDDAAYERGVGERVDLNERGIAHADARDIRFIDLHLCFKHTHVADRHECGRILVQRPHDRRFAFFDVEPGDLAAHRGDDRGAVERLAGVTH